MANQSQEEALAGTVPVVLVDDHEIWRGGVKSMLGGSEFTVIGEAASGNEAIELARALHDSAPQPQMMLLDIRMAGGDGLDALETLKRDFPAMAVVMLTTYENPTYMARAVAAGAAGYLLKGIERDELLAALRHVVARECL
jgi:DNA-binding NarL/FixJ family response regulator